MNVALVGKIAIAVEEGARHIAALVGEQHKNLLLERIAKAAEQSVPPGGMLGRKV